MIAFGRRAFCAVQVSAGSVHGFFFTPCNVWILA